jgi:ubiquitin carboxyl-terminal hydrolase 9/24
MNSYFQQIFKVEEFRLGLLLCEDPAFDIKDTKNNVFYQVKKMFLNLMNSDKKAYNPKSFCHSFKDYEGNPTNVSEQMDIDEFSGILCDRL